MQEWRATRPVDVARLNASVLVAALRKYGIVLALGAPAYLCALVLLAQHRSPSSSPQHVLTAAIPYFLTAIVGHFALGVVGLGFLAAIGSLVWWRHVLATGTPAGALAAIASLVRRVVFQVARCPEAALPAAVVHRVRDLVAVLSQDLLDQLCAALVIAPDAPPLRLALLADGTVRTDQLTSRRVA